MVESLLDGRRSRGWLTYAVGIALAGITFAVPALGQAADGTAIDAPKITTAQRQFLSRVARRTMRDKLAKRAIYEPEFVPVALHGLTAEVVVRLRQSGYLVGAGAGGPDTLTRATRDAALAAAAQFQERGAADGEVVGRSLIEIEVVGASEEIVVEGDWTRPRALDAHIEPGIHGLVMLGPKKQSRICPTELFTHDKTVTDALRDLAPLVASDPQEAAKMKLMRFRTTHWYAAPLNDSIVSLERGLTPVPPDALTRAGLRQAIDRLAEYMVYRQKSTGLFSYQYEPGSDRYSDDDNLVRQVGAAAALAIHARWSGKESSRAAAEMAIRHHLQGLTPVPGDARAAYIATADQSNKLGVTALLTIALGAHPDAARFAETREKLVRGMLWRQRPSGMFLTAFPPSEEVGAQDYFPGEALLAMAEAYHHAPSAAILDAFDRAIRFYHEYFEDAPAPAPAFVPWQVQAFSKMATFTRRRDYIDFVFTLSDWLSAHQLHTGNGERADLCGGIAPYSPGRAGIATASYLEGFADALTLAREVGDAERAGRYEAVVRGAARFVLQLQMRPEEAYFVRSPQDAVWGMRTAPALNLLRIDHCQHALVALMKTCDVLFGEGS